MPDTLDLLAPFDAPIRARLAELLAHPPPGAYAAFDADGTLWDDDINEALLARLADAGALPRWPGTGEEILRENDRRLAEDRRRGYVWAVEIMAGARGSDVDEASKFLAREWAPPRVRPALRGLVAACEAAGVPAYIVSASPQWLVREAAPLVGIDPERTFGFQLAVGPDGRMVEHVHGTVTCFDGKVEALRLARRTDQGPLIAAGDSMGDLDLLGAASGLALVVGRTDKPENELQRRGRERGWALQRLPPTASAGT